MTENLIAVQEAAGFSRDEVGGLVRNASISSWLTEAEKAQFLLTVDEYCSTVPG